MKSVVLMLADGFEEMEAVIPADVLRRAGFKVSLVSVTGRKGVTGSHGIRVEADLLFGDADFGEVDMVVLPGGMPGAAHLNTHEGLRQLLPSILEDGKLVGALCAAPMVLGNLGLLVGKRATCYPGFEKYLHGAVWSGEAVVSDGQVVTANGAGAALPFALRLVEVLADRESAVQTARKMMVPGY